MLLHFVKRWLKSTKESGLYSYVCEQKRGAEIGAKRIWGQQYPIHRTTTGLTVSGKKFG